MEKLLRRRIVFHSGLSLRRYIGTGIMSSEKEVVSQDAGEDKMIPRKRESSPGGSGLAKQRDSNGFKLRRQAMDLSTKTAYESLGGKANNENISHLQDTTKSIKEEETEGAVWKIEGSLRKLPPYYFTYLTYCKERWRNRTILDIFTTEFRDKDEAYYKKMIETGQVVLNQKPADLETLVRNGDLISHRVHRHEPAVTSREIKIVHEDDDTIVIDKPSGIPVHPTGRYRFNTITKIFQHEKGATVHPSNRLDRLTSGLMFLAKTSKGADKMAQQIRDRDVSKEYIARVIGEFPLDEITVEQPLKTISPKLGLNRVDPDGKDAKTVFKRISYDGHTSIVLCKPLTGRTHQIRVHLQYIGHPIANDPIYSNAWVWGEKLGKEGDGDIEEIKNKLNRIGKDVSSTTWFHPESDGEVLTGDKCEVCECDLYTDPSSNDLDLWLHAYKYEAFDKSWSYKTEYPEWALDSHRKFMELALEEANNCGETQTAFSVGALLVHNTEILSTGYSRELPGNTHAEQCALEKYYTKTGKRDLPEGTIIYTTMEPCSERLSGNLPCVDRILDTNIKTCFVGVMEPDTFVKNNVGYSKLKQAGVEYIHIPGYEDECLKIAFKGHAK